MTDSWDDEFFSCAKCQTSDVVPPCGPIDSPILVIGTSPGEEEVKDGIPFAGKTGGVFKTELRLAGLDFSALRVTNLWQHPANKREDCLQEGAAQCIAEARGRKAILLVGAETVKYFAHCSVEANNGLPVQSDYFSCPLIYAIVQPTTVFHGGIGDFRLALSKFVVKVENLI